MRAKGQPAKGDLKKTEAQLIEELEQWRGGQKTSDGHGPGEVNSFTSAQLFGILEAADDAIISMDENFRIRIFNKGAEKIFGYTFDEVFEQPIDVLLPVDVRDIHRRHVEKFGTSRDSSRLMGDRSEVFGLRKNGERFPAEASISKIEVGGQRFFTVILRDITERKLAEDELRRSQSQLEAVFNTVPNSLWIKDKDSRYLKVNPALAANFNLSVEDFEGLSTEDTIVGSEENRANFVETDRQVFDSGERVELPELTVTMPSGERRLRHVIKLPLRDELGNVTGLVGISQDITERKRAEVELRSSRSRLEKTLESLSDALFIVDPRTRTIVSSNPAIEQVFGYSEQEVLGKNTEFLHKNKEAYEEFGRRLFPELDRRGRFRCEFEMRRKDGSVFDSDISVTEIHDESGERTAVISIVRDISERKRAEEELRASQRLLQTVFDTIPHSLFVKDRDSRYLMVNHAMAARFNLQPQDFQGAHTMEMMEGTEEERMERISNDRSVLESGQGVDLPEFVVSTSGGGQRVQHVTKLPLLDDSGEVVGIVGVSEDITERKRAEEELRKSQRLLRSVVDSVPHTIVVKDPESRYLMVNKSWSEFYGVQPRDAINKHSLDIPGRPEQDKEHVLDEDQLVFNGDGLPKVFDHTRTDSKGRTRYLQNIRTPIKNETGEIEGLVAIALDITERKQAEEELRASQRLLQTIFDTVPHWLFVKDQEGRFKVVNRSLADFFQSKPEEFVNKKFGDFAATADDISASEKSDRRVIETNQLMDFPDRQSLAADGSTRTRHVIKLPLRDDDGNAIGVVGISEDITQRKRAEEASRINEERIQLLLDHSPWGIVLKDIEGRFLLANNHFASWVGHDVAGLLGKTAHNLYPADFAEKVAAQDREVVKTGISTDRTYEFPTSDGSIRTMLNTKFPVFDPENNVVGVGGIVTDITERMQFETALQESEERFRAIFDHSPSTIFLQDMEGRYILVNKRFEEMYGISAAEAIGKTSFDVFPEEIAKLYVDQDKKVLESKQVTNREFEVPISGHPPRTVISTKFPVFGNDGQAVGVGTISTDLTEHKKIEAQLRESQKMEAVGQLAGGIAHEFNNMLQVIINSAHFARNSLHESAIADEFLGSILKSAGRSATLTKQLLAYSRKTALRPSTVNLNELTVSLMKMLRPVIGEDIELEFRKRDEIFTVKADQGQLEQAIINLCLNARDAMPDGGRLVFETNNHHADQEYCDIHGWSLPGDYAKISVSDNGAGMTSEIRDRIFEPFFTTKEVGQGTGLGLAMVHGIVQQHDGVLEALSEPGVGSTFNIYLPRTKAQKTRIQVPVVSDIPGGSETVLVAEDEEDVLKMMSQTLESKGYRVLTAKDGDEAMSVFKANSDRIDLVIVDMVMPKLNGRAVFDGIRENGSDVPVLFSTGYSLDTADAEYIAGKGLQTIQKPYAPSVLYSTVREVLDKR